MSQNSKSLNSKPVVIADDDDSLSSQEDIVGEDVTSFVGAQKLDFNMPLVKIVATQPTIPKKSFEELARERPSQKSRLARKRARNDSDFYGGGSSALQLQRSSLADVDVHRSGGGRPKRNKNRNNDDDDNYDDDHDDDDDDDDDLIVVPKAPIVVDMNDPELLESKEKLRNVSKILLADAESRLLETLKANEQQQNAAAAAAASAVANDIIILQARSSLCPGTTKFKVKKTDNIGVVLDGFCAHTQLPRDRAYLLVDRIRVPESTSLAEARLFNNDRINIEFDAPKFDVANVSTATVNNIGNNTDNDGGAASANQLPDGSQNDEGIIRIKVRFKNVDKFFKISMDEPLSKMMQKACDTLGQSYVGSVFEFDGERLNPDATPRAMDLEDEDMITLTSTGNAAAAATPATATMEDEENMIRIKVRFKNNDKFFKIPKNEPMLKMMQKACETVGQPFAKSIFEFDGERLDPNSTPLAMDLEDEDLITIRN